MPSKEELIKIREEAIEEYIKKNKIEQYLFFNAQEYYNKFITSKLVYQAINNLKNAEAIVRDSGIFITTNNEEKAKLFYGKIPPESLNVFSYSDIDNISTEDNPIIHISGYVGNKPYSYFTRTSYIKRLAEEEKYDFKINVRNTPNMDGNIFIDFEVSTKVPKLVFSSSKILIKKS